VDLNKAATSVNSICGKNRNNEMVALPENDQGDHMPGYARNVVSFHGCINKKTSSYQKRRGKWDS
jgi:hypothetical protein